jgi:hypothetical protein
MASAAALPVRSTVSSTVELRCGRETSTLIVAAYPLSRSSTSKPLRLPPSENGKERRFSVLSGLLEKRAATQALQTSHGLLKILCSAGPHFKRSLKNVQMMAKFKSTQITLVFVDIRFTFLFTDAFADNNPNERNKWNCFILGGSLGLTARLHSAKYTIEELYSNPFNPFAKRNAQLAAVLDFSRASA